MTDTNATVDKLCRRLQGIAYRMLGVPLMRATASAACASTRNATRTSSRASRGHSGTN